MSVDLDKIERLAKEATPGTWKHRDKLDDGTPHCDVVAIQPDDWRIVAGSDPALWDIDPADAAYIAAANPAVVLDLIRRVEEAEAIVRDLAKTDIGNDDSFCDLCKNSWSHKATCPYRRAVEASK